MCSGLIIQFFRYSTVSVGRVVDLRCCVALALSIMVVCRRDYIDGLAVAYAWRGPGR